MDEQSIYVKGAGLVCDLPSDISWVDHILNYSGNGRS